MSNGRVLYRSQNNKVFAGICGGVGEYFNIDPSIVRLIWVVAGLMFGSGIIAYIIALFIVPKGPHW
jgi:phage shock protein C